MHKININTIQEEWINLRHFCNAVLDQAQHLNYQRWWEVSRLMFKNGNKKTKQYISKWNEELIKNMQEDVKRYKKIKGRSKINITNIINETSIQSKSIKVTENNQKEIKYVVHSSYQVF